MSTIVVASLVFRVYQSMRMSCSLLEAVRHEDQMVSIRKRQRESKPCSKTCQRLNAKWMHDRLNGGK